ncbi:hypothetical protein AUJ14_00105 [Candidatus Micrarchaeota archaeon CG1_02_55_22]|nr:MAG: hypothetical protein AUJ14_00105 [Candidatus Micrarchaeota archaeon CG1_02_55_22]
MFYLYKLRQDEFSKAYHQRSLVESSFSALKRKFNGNLKSKSELGKVNEALAKILCYNICVLIHEAKKNGLELDFKSADAVRGPSLVTTKTAQQPIEPHNNPSNGAPAP